MKTKKERLLEYLGYYAYLKNGKDTFLSWKEFNQICSWLKIERKIAKEILKYFGFKYNNRGIYVEKTKLKL